MRKPITFLNIINGIVKDIAKILSESGQVSPNLTKIRGFLATMFSRIHSKYDATQQDFLDERKIESCLASVKESFKRDNKIDIYNTFEAILIEEFVLKKSNFDFRKRDSKNFSSPELILRPVPLENQTQKINLFGKCPTVVQNESQNLKKRKTPSFSLSSQSSTEDAKKFSRWQSFSRDSDRREDSSQDYDRSRSFSWKDFSRRRSPSPDFDGRQSSLRDFDEHQSLYPDSDRRRSRFQDFGRRRIPSREDSRWQTPPQDCDSWQSSSQDIVSQPKETKKRRNSTSSSSSEWEIKEHTHFNTKIFFRGLGGKKTYVKKNSNKEVRLRDRLARLLSFSPENNACCAVSILSKDQFKNKVLPKIKSGGKLIVSYNDPDKRQPDADLIQAYVVNRLRIIRKFNQACKTIKAENSEETMIKLRIQEAAEVSVDELTGNGGLPNLGKVNDFRRKERLVKDLVKLANNWQLPDDKDIDLVCLVNEKSAKVHHAEQNIMQYCIDNLDELEPRGEIFIGCQKLGCLDCTATDVYLKAKGYQFCIRGYSSLKYKNVSNLAGETTCNNCNQFFRAGKKMMETEHSNLNDPKNIKSVTEARQRKYASDSESEAEWHMPKM